MTPIRTGSLAAVAIAARSVRPASPPSVLPIRPSADRHSNACSKAGPDKTLMRWHGGQPLRRQLFLGISFLLFPVLAAAIWSGWATFRERTLELAEQADLVAATTAA